METDNVFATLLARDVVNDIINDKESSGFFDEGELFIALEKAYIKNEVNEFSTGEYVANITNKVIEETVKDSIDESIIGLIDAGLINTAIDENGNLVYSLNTDNNEIIP
jgi:hypothetical protein